MKTLFRVLAVGAVAIFAFTACQPGPFAPFIGGSEEAEDELISNTNPNLASADPVGAPFQQSAFTGPSGVTSNEVITIDFDNGVVDVEDGSIPGLSIATLSDSADSEGLYSVTGTLSYSATVVPDGNGNSTAYITLDLSGTTVSDLLQIELNAENMTADGGAKNLNQDGDQLPGENPDDFEYLYPTVAGAPVATPAAATRDPRAGITLSISTPPADGSNTFELNHALAPDDDSTRDSLSAGLSVWQLDTADLTWSELSVTYAYDTGTGVLTVTLPANAAIGDVYQVRYDRYNVATNTPYLGFVQRMSYDQFAPPEKSDLQLVGTAASLDIVTNPGGTGVPVQFAVNFGGAPGDVITSTVTNDSVRIFWDDDVDGVAAGLAGDVKVNWDFFAVTSGADGDNTLTFYMPADFEPDPGDGWRVQVYPAVIVDAGTPDDASDDVPVINDTETEFGISEDNAIF
jgi:hypothetical protein